MDVVPRWAATSSPPASTRRNGSRVYDDKLAAGGDTADPPTASTGAAGPRGPISADGRWALPAPTTPSHRGTLDDPHHDYPAWDFLIPEGTPIYAITDGIVVTTQHWNGNWWRAGCGHAGAPAGCNTCGNGLTIQTADGLRHTYCHNQRLHVNDGDPIVAGQHIADSGDTGRSGAPHLHLELRLNDRQHCPQPLLAALYHQRAHPRPGQPAHQRLQLLTRERTTRMPITDPTANSPLPSASSTTSSSTSECHDQHDVATAHAYLARQRRTLHGPLARRHRRLPRRRHLARRPAPTARNDPTPRPPHRPARPNDTTRQCATHTLLSRPSTPVTAVNTRRRSAPPKPRM